MLFNNIEYIQELKKIPIWKRVRNNKSIDMVCYLYYGNYDWVLELMVINQLKGILIPEKQKEVVIPTLENLILLKEKYK